MLEIRELTNSSEFASGLAGLIRQIGFSSRGSWNLGGTQYVDYFGGKHDSFHKLA